jgi:hypothetical protein
MNRICRMGFHRIRARLFFYPVHPVYPVCFHRFWPWFYYAPPPLAHIDCWPPVHARAMRILCAYFVLIPSKIAPILLTVRGTKFGPVPCERCAEARQSYIPQPPFKAAAVSGFCLV